MRALLSVLILHCSIAAVFAAEPRVDLRLPGGDLVEVQIDGQPFSAYCFGDDLPKPFFSPVLGPDGVAISRPLENPKDHPHHKGIWLSVDEVNGVDFWAEKGKIDTISVEPIIASGNPAQMKVVNHWLGADGVPVVTETTIIGIHANRLLTYDITFTAGDAAVTFGDTKEGLFGFRMVDALREREGGHVVNAEGLEGAAACWGKTSGWVDYYGEVDGKTVGVAIFDHPLNFRPSRYHVRDYGLFSISPFGESAYTSGNRPADEAMIVPGGSLRLRYAIYVHAGDTATGEVGAVYRKYLAQN